LGSEGKNSFFVDKLVSYLKENRFGDYVILHEGLGYWANAEIPTEEVMKVLDVLTEVEEGAWVEISSGSKEVLAKHLGEGFTVIVKTKPELSQFVKRLIDTILSNKEVPKCSRCGADLYKVITKCPRCGNEILAGLPCPYCGYGGVRRCSCGARIDLNGNVVPLFNGRKLAVGIAVAAAAAAILYPVNIIVSIVAFGALSLTALALSHGG